MKINSVRANDIKAFLNDRNPETNLFERIHLEGIVNTYPVFRVPISKLYFNIRNGRFAAEILGREKQLGKKLNPFDEEDALEIRKLLLNQNADETKNLREDLLRHGQVDPGIVTHDGAVINANRRMAVISALYEETRDDKWAYLKVAVLPSNVGEKDLWKIEAGLQFGKDFRLEYGPINELLKLREGIACGLDAKDISASLLGRFTDEDVKGRLAVLSLIDDYLECIGKPGDYELITQKRSMEKFNSLQANVIASLKKKDTVTPKELGQITAAAFAMIEKTDLNYLDIRKLAHIARQPDAFSAFKDTLPKEPLKASSEVLEDAFKVGADLVDDKKLKDKPAKLIRQALSAVQSIDSTNNLLQSPEVQQLLESLIAKASSLRVNKNSPKK